MIAMTPRDYQKKIVNSMTEDGWVLGVHLPAGEGFKVPLTNAKSGSLIVAAHAEVGRDKWKFYGSLQDIREWEISVNKLTDEFVVREFVKNSISFGAHESMRSQSPQEIVMNALWGDFK